MSTRDTAEPGRAIEERVLEVLRRHVSPPTARAVLELARERARLVDRALGRPQLEELIPHVTRGLGLFVSSASDLSLAEDRLAAVASSLPSASPRSAEAPTASRAPRERLSAARHALEGELAVVAAASAGRLAIRVEEDVVRVRGEVRRAAGALGFSSVEQTKVATVVSELARNIVMYAGTGELAWCPLPSPKRGLEIAASDDGPGIADLAAVLDGGYRSRHGMGLGLRGVRALTHEMTVDTAPGRGTRVVARMMIDAR